MRTILAVLMLTVSTGVMAKLPAPSAEAQAKAKEAAAKAAWSGKVAGYQLCLSQDKIAAAYFANARANNLQTKTPQATPPCTDPGPYVAAKPSEAKPIEASGAHSSAETASGPPSSAKPEAKTGTAN